METILPAALALLAAFLWGLCNHIQRVALDDTDALTGAFISVGVVAIICWIAAPFFVDPQWWGSRGTLIFALTGIFFPALGQRFQIASVSLVGPSLTASISAIAPLISVGLGVVFLAEAPGLRVAFGVVLTITGIVLATWSPRGITRGWPLWAVFVPLGAALVRGISQPGVKTGLQDVPSPLFALLVTTTVSSVVLGAMLLNHHRQRRTRFGRGVKWFAVNGFVNGSGILAINAALSLGPLALVSPLAGTVPLWTVFFGVVVFKRELLAAKHWAVAGLVVLGGVLIVLP